MTAMKLKKDQIVIVAGSGGSEQVLKFTVADVQSDGVTLDFESSAGVSVHTSEEWDRLQAARKAAKQKQGADRPKQNAPYMN